MHLGERRPSRDDVMSLLSIVRSSTCGDTPPLRRQHPPLLQHSPSLSPTSLDDPLSSSRTTANAYGCLSKRVSAFGADRDGVVPFRGVGQVPVRFQDPAGPRRPPPPAKGTSNSRRSPFHRLQFGETAGRVGSFPAAVRSIS